LTRWLSLLRKELATLWVSPLPYVMGALFHLVAGVLYVEQLDVRGQALYQPLFPIAGFLLIALVPLITMRSVAEERSSQTFPVLLAVPVPAHQIVLAKWAAAWLTAAATVAALAAPLLLVARWGDPDPGPGIAGLIGLLLLSGALSAIGVGASALTSSQAVAGVAAFFAGMLLWFSHVGSGGWSGGEVLAHFSLSERMRSFSGGVVDATDVALLAILSLGALLMAWLVLQPGVAARGRPARDRTTRSRRLPLAAALLGLAGLALADRAASSLPLRWDLTAESSLTLSAETRRVLAALDQPVEAIAFIPRASPQRTQTAALLERYRDANRRLSFRLDDPQRSPAQAVQLGIDPDSGGIVFRAGDRTQTAALASEQDLTSALARLQREESPGVCFTTGHGEADAGGSIGSDIGAAVGSLVANGYRVRAVDLLVEPSIPADCEAVVLANPAVDLNSVATAAVATYLAGGGRAMVLADPVSTADFTALLAPYGLRPERGLVVEGDPEARLGPDPLTVVVRRFLSPNPAVRELAPVLFPGSLGITTESDASAGLSAEPLATSSARSFLEVNPVSGSGGAFSPKFDPGLDRTGPVTIAAAADRSERDGSEVIRTRVIVVGDVDWATNAFLGEGGNSRLFLQTMDWLTVEEDLVSVTTNLAAFRPLDLSPARLTVARSVAAGAVPGAFVVSGLAVWLVRRRR